MPAHLRALVRFDRDVELAATEAAFAYLARRRAGAFRACMVLALTGPPLDRRKLAGALERLQRRHPFLRGVLADGPAGPVLRPADLPVEVCSWSRDHPEAWRDAWRSVEGKPLVRHALLHSVWCVEPPGGGWGDREVVWICEHAICDAISLRTLGEELLAVLGGIDDGGLDDALQITPPLEQLAEPHLPSGSDLVARTLGMLAREASGSRSDVRLVPKLSGSKLGGRQPLAATVMAHRTLDEERLGMMLDRARAQHSGLLGMVSASLALACVEHRHGPTPGPGATVGLSFPVDLRRRYSEPIGSERLGCHIGAVVVRRPLPAADDEASLWELARSVRDGLGEAMSPERGEHWLHARLGGRGLHSLRSPLVLSEATVNVSNMGRANAISEAGPWRVRGRRLFYDASLRPLPTVAVEGTSAGLELFAWAPGGSIPQGRLDAVLDGTLRRLGRLAR